MNIKEDDKYSLLSGCSSWPGLPKNDPSLSLCQALPPSRSGPASPSLELLLLRSLGWADPIAGLAVRRSPGKGSEGHTGLHGMEQLPRLLISITGSGHQLMISSGTRRATAATGKVGTPQTLPGHPANPSAVALTIQPSWCGTKQERPTSGKDSRESGSRQPNRCLPKSREGKGRPGCCRHWKRVSPHPWAQVLIQPWPRDGAKDTYWCIKGAPQLGHRRMQMKCWTWSRGTSDPGRGKKADLGIVTLTLPFFILKPGEAQGIRTQWLREGRWGWWWRCLTTT